MRLDRMEFTVSTETSVVDEQVDFEAFVLRELEDFLWSVRLNEIREENFGLDFVFGGKLLRQSVKPLAAPRRKHKICFAARKFFGEGFADAGACSRDQRPFSRPGGHCFVSRKRLSVSRRGECGLCGTRFECGESRGYFLADAAH